MRAPTPGGTFPVNNNTNNINNNTNNMAEREQGLDVIADVVVTMVMNTTVTAPFSGGARCDAAHAPGGDSDAAWRRLCYMDYIGHGVVIVVICLVGAVMNVLNLVVLRSRHLPESCYVYLSGLALADLLSLAFFGTNSVGRGHHAGEHAWGMYEVYGYFPLCSVTTMASVILTITVSVERYIYIYRPHKAKLWCVPARARRITCLIWAAAVLINTPRFFIFEVGDDGALGYTTFGRSVYYRIISWAYFLLVSLGGCVALIVLNILLIRGIHRSHARRRCLTSKKAHKAHDERRLTLTLIAIICVFIIGELPSSFVSRLLLVPMAGPEILLTAEYKVAAIVATALVVLQHSLNFVVYCVFNRKFWTVFKQTLCGACADNQIDRRSSTHEPPSGNSHLSEHNMFPIDAQTNGSCHVVSAPVSHLSVNAAVHAV